MFLFLGYTPQAEATVQRAGKEQAATAMAGGKSCEVCCVAYYDCLGCILLAVHCIILLLWLLFVEFSY
jgi:hypothetical protein